jgi:L-amino acid N-acyltransferase YncA
MIPSGEPPTSPPVVNHRDIELRLASSADAPDLCEIYRPYVEETPISFEAIAPSREEMASRVDSVLPRFPWLVAQVGERIVGYAYAHEFAARAAYRWSIESSIYIRDDFQRRGIGTALYSALLGIAAAQGYQECFAGIALPNDSSIRMHEAIGFSRVATFQRVGWKRNSWHDVGWWQRSLGDRDDAPPEPIGLDLLGHDLLGRFLVGYEGRS